MGLGFWEIMAIVIVAVIFFGPSRLPGLGRSVGEAIRGFKKGMEGLHDDVTSKDSPPASSRPEQLSPSQPRDEQVKAEKAETKNSDPS